MTLPELLAELKAAGLLERARRVKCGDIEIELAQAIDTEPKTMTIAIPQQHGTGLSENESKRVEEDELIAGLYGASQGVIPSYGPE